MLSRRDIKMGKDPTKPRGKMSSYAYFVQTCREEHKKKHPEASVNFSEFSKKCSERWKVRGTQGCFPGGRSEGVRNGRGVGGMETEDWFTTTAEAGQGTGWGRGHMGYCTTELFGVMALSCFDGLN